MLGINCLYRNAQLKDELQDLIEVYGSELIESDKVPTVGNVYRAIITDGFEIDAQTVGHLYREAFSDEIGSDMYSSESEILDFINEPYIKLLAAEAEDMKARGIGRNAPVQAVVSSLMNGLKMIEQANPTVQRIMQDRLAKGAKRVSGYKGEQSGVKLTTEDIISELILINRNNKFSAEFSVMENAEIMWKEFKKEFSEVAKMLKDKGDLYNADKIMSYADLLEKATYQLLMSTPEIQKVINDTLKEAGYKKQVGSKEVVDWNKVINDTTIDFRQVFKSVFSGKFNEKELSWIADEMDREFTKVRVAKTTSALESRNKWVTSRTQKTALRKFTDLYNLGIFSASNQKALFRLLGVKETTEKQVNALERLGKVLSDAQNSPIEKWSDTFLKTLHREIEVITEMAEEGSDVAVKMARMYATYVQMSNALIISNPQNVAENTITGINHLFMMTLLTQPMQAVKMMKVLWHTASDVVKGGVRTGNEEINTFNKIGHSEDRFNYETAKTPMQKIIAGINLAPRLLLSVADNSIKSAMMQQVGIDLLKNEIRKQGFDKDETNLIISEIFYGNRAQLEDIAKSFEERLVASGVHASKGKWKRMADELAWANMETNGQFFKAIWSDLQAAGKFLGKELLLDDVLLKQIKNAAESAASRSLGHRADNIVGEFIDRWAGAIGEDVSRARQEGHGLGRSTAKQALYGQLTAFRYGGIRWMFLTYEKTGIGLLQTLITDVLFEKLGFSKFLPHALNKKYNEVDKLISEAKDKKDIDELIKIRGERMEWYAARKQRIIRNTVGALQGYFALMAFVFINQGGGDDDDKKRALLELAKDIAKDRSLNRWAQKTYPTRVYNYLTSIARINSKTGKLMEKPLKYIELPSDMEWYDIFLGFGKNIKGKEGPQELYQIFLNNMNDSKVMGLLSALKNLSLGESGAAFGEAVAGAVATSPLKLYDMWSGAFKSQPLEKNKVKPETFLDGFIRQWATKDMFKNYMK